jgi:hypothetical protein
MHGAERWVRNPSSFVISRIPPEKIVFRMTEDTGVIFFCFGRTGVTTEGVLDLFKFVEMTIPGSTRIFSQSSIWGRC